MFHHAGLILFVDGSQKLSTLMFLANLRLCLSDQGDITHHAMCFVAHLCDALNVAD
jgi:hypothetical protein